MVSVDVLIKGMALNDFGFTVNGAFSGTGLNTFGFLWDCSAIWESADPSVTTTWTTCSTPSGIYEICEE